MERRPVNRPIVVLGVINLCFAWVMASLGSAMAWLLFLVGVMGVAIGLYPPRQEKLPWIPALSPRLIVGLSVLACFLPLLLFSFLQR
jgi:uncharacterized membrane protein